MANESLGKAKSRKNDEFYTVYDYIQKEMNAYLEYDPNVFRGKTILLPCDDPEWSNFTKYFAQNFETLGIKKLISTSYATDRKKQQYEQYHQMTLFELNFPQYDEEKSHSHGKIFTLTRDINKSGVIDIDDLEWQYLEGDGDFRSDEVCALRDEADIIVTNPPFSLFREFVAWVMEAEKKIVVIGNQNAITYKEIFPLLKENKLWIGATNNGQDMVFEVPEGAIVAPKDKEKAEKLGYKGNYTRLGNACWFTNIDHGRRHQPLSLMTMADNLKYSKHKQIREQGYLKYDNYDAIEVPFVDAIPSDYVEDMGVPITYLQRHNPEQFEVVKFRKGDDEKDLTYTIDSSTILTDRQTDGQTRAEKKGSGKHVIWIALLVLFAAPVGAPLLVALAAVVLSLVVCMLAILLCVVLLAACLVIIGGKIIARGILAVPISMSGFAMLTGSGLLAMGVGILGVLLCIYLCKWSSMLIAKLVRRITNRKRG